MLQEFKVCFLFPFDKYQPDVLQAVSPRKQKENSFESDLQSAGSSKSVSTLVHKHNIHFSPFDQINAPFNKHHGKELQQKREDNHLRKKTICNHRLRIFTQHTPVRTLSCDASTQPNASVDEKES